MALVIINLRNLLIVKSWKNKFFYLKLKYENIIIKTHKDYFFYPIYFDNLKLKIVKIYMNITHEFYQN